MAMEAIAFVFGLFRVTMPEPNTEFLARAATAQASSQARAGRGAHDLKFFIGWVTALLPFAWLWFRLLDNLRVEWTTNPQYSYGWFVPRASYVFRADYEPFERVRFSAVRGDFDVNEGVWELIPRRDGAATVVTYRAHVVPRFFVPRWLALASLKRDLPELLQGLRARCEAP